MSDQLPTAARVADPGIRALYRLENRWQAWLDVEVALARAQAELGIIPAEAVAPIAAAARLELLHPRRGGDRCDRLGRDDAELGLRPGQRHLDIEPGLPAVFQAIKGTDPGIGDPGRG